MIRGNKSKLLQVLQFLALDDKQRFKCLPKKRSGMKLAIHETDIKTDSMMLCVGYECWNTLDRNKGNNEFFHLLSEMECLLDAMIADDRRYWIWQDKPSMGDHLFWHVLRRLAKEALKIKRWPQQPPKINLKGFITIGRWIPSRKLGRSSTKHIVGD